MQRQDNMLEDAIRYADLTLILIQEVKATFPTTLVINDESEDYKYTFNLPEDHVTTWRDTINMNGPPFWGLAVGVPRNSDIETKMIIDTSPRFQTVIRRKLLIVNVYHHLLYPRYRQESGQLDADTLTSLLTSNCPDVL